MKGIQSSRRQACALRSLMSEAVRAESNFQKQQNTTSKHWEAAYLKASATKGLTSLVGHLRRKARMREISSSTAANRLKLNRESRSYRSRKC